MTLDEFDGTFAITDHSLIPGGLHNYLAERFYNATRLSRVSLDDVNAALNEVWQGPGSLAHVQEETQRLREQRKAGGEDSFVNKEPVQTIDDFSGSDFNYTHTTEGKEDGPV